MEASRWQKQHVHFRRNVWGASATISTLLLIVLLAIGVGMAEAGGVIFVVFVISRVLLAFFFNNRYANAMVRVLKFDFEEIERDFRMVFKNEGVRYYRNVEKDAYCYEFPGHSLSMTVQPHWLSFESHRQPVTKVTLRLLSAKNKEFAEMLAMAIDNMAERRANDGDKSDAPAPGAPDVR